MPSGHLSLSRETKIKLMTPLFLTRVVGVQSLVMYNILLASLNGINQITVNKFAVKYYDLFLWEMTFLLV